MNFKLGRNAIKYFDLIREDIIKKTDVIAVTLNTNLRKMQVIYNE